MFRHLCLELGKEYEEKTQKNEDISKIEEIVYEIVPFYVTHNAEADACDLLMSVDRV